MSVLDLIEQFYAKHHCLAFIREAIYIPKCQWKLVIHCYFVRQRRPEQKQGGEKKHKGQEEEQYDSRYE